MRSPAKEIGIGVTTKDRWDELRLTLEQLRSLGLDQLETLVIDDGSVTPMPDGFGARFPWVKFERFDASRGLIVQRNHIARSLNAPFYLSIDDDSFPVFGNLDAAVAWMQEHPKAAVLGFKVVLGDRPAPTDGANHSPILTRDFTGCGFLLRRDLFLSLGGFDERLQMYCEEMEYSLRVIGKGHEIYFYPAVVIRHMHSHRGRDNESRSYLIIRNHILIALWYYPFPFSLVWSLWWSVMKTPFPYRKTFAVRRSIFMGALSGWGRFLSWRGEKRLSQAQFREWRAKPFLASL